VAARTGLGAGGGHAGAGAAGSSDTSLAHSVAGGRAPWRPANHPDRALLAL
jgi:hypothetical protein